MENPASEIVIGNCRLEAKLGQGGMGAVYKGLHLVQNRAVAVKVLPTDLSRNPEYVNRFLREARAVKALNHPNIVELVEAGQHQGQYFIVMEFVDGGSLAAHLEERGPFQETVALQLLSQAAQGLGAAHAQGLVHRDIKPENLLWGREGRLRIVDFGLVSAGEGEAGLTRAGTMLGTPYYMSPEQCEGRYDVRSDLYALGACFFHIMTGTPPFVDTTPMGIMFKHLRDPVPNPRSINPQLGDKTVRILMKLLSKAPEQRYQTAAELVADLEHQERAENFGSLLMNGDQAAQLRAALAAGPHGAGAQAAYGNQAPPAPAPMPASQVPTQARPAPLPQAPLQPVVPSQAYVPTQVPLTAPAMSGAPMQGGPAMAPAYGGPGTITSLGMLPQGQPSSVAPSGYYAPPNQAPLGQTGQPGYPPPQGSAPAWATQSGVGAPGMPGVPNQSAAWNSGAAPAVSAVMEPRPASRWLWFWVTLLIVIIAGVLGVGVWLFIRHREITGYLERAREYRTAKQFDAAEALLQDALSTYPNDEELKSYLESTHGAYAAARIVQLKDQAREAFDSGRYADAASAYTEALALQTKSAGLPGFDQDKTLSGLKEQAETQRDFHTALRAGQAAEEQGHFEDALASYDRAKAFDVPGRADAVAAYTRVSLKQFTTQAAVQEKARHYGAAYELLQKADALHAQNLDADLARLKKAAEFERLVEEAEANLKAGKALEATVSFKQSLLVAPDDEKAGVQARIDELQRAWNFDDALQKGKDAAKQDRWPEAFQFFEVAVKMRPAHAEALKLLKDAEIKVCSQKADLAEQGRDWRAMLAAYTRLAELSPTAGVQQKLKEARVQVDAVERIAASARDDETKSRWADAVVKWKRLAKDDPLESVRYLESAKRATLEQYLDSARALFLDGRFDDAQARAQEAKDLEGSGGKRAQGLLEQIEARRLEKTTLDQCYALVKDGKIQAAVKLAASLPKSEAPDARDFRTALDGLGKLDSGTQGLDSLRQEAVAATQSALDADTLNKRIKGFLDQLNGWAGTLAAPRESARAALLEKRYSDMQSQGDALKTAARDLANALTQISVDLKAEAANIARANRPGAVAKRADAPRPAQVVFASAETVNRTGDKIRKVLASQ